MQVRLVVLVLIALVAGGWWTAERTIWVPEIRSGEQSYRPARPTDTIPRSIEAAEAEGAAYPRSTEPINFNPSLTEGVTAGSGTRRCVRADTTARSRSGDFFIGQNIALLAEEWRAGVRGGWKTSWHTSHRPMRIPMQLTVRVARIDSAGPAFVYTSESIKTQRIVREYQRYGQTWATGWGSIDLPTAGTWMLVATSRDVWGCFTIEL